MQVAEGDLDDRQPVDKLHEPPATRIERARAEQQQRREGQRERVVGQHVRHGGHRTGKKQRHQPQRIGVAAHAKPPEHGGGRKGRKAKLDRQRSAVGQIDAAQVHEHSRVERGRDPLRIGQHQVVGGQPLGNEIDPHLRTEQERGRGSERKRRDGGGSKHAPAPRRDQHDRKQDAKLRLQRGQADQDARRDRPTIEPDENRDQHRGGDERTLPRDHAKDGGGRQQQCNEHPVVSDVVA